jgi:uncharacterized protein
MLAADVRISPRFEASEVSRATAYVTMEDGTRLATEVYLPPSTPAPVLLRRTPYGRRSREPTLVQLVQLGYAVVSQDCRGTGESEPVEWTYYLFEPEDSRRLVDWVLEQSWCDGFIGGIGGSYVGATQWCMATHERMSAIAPEVAGLGVRFETAAPYMFLNALIQSVGNDAKFKSTPISEVEKALLPETLAGGLFNEPMEVPLPDAALRMDPDLGGLSPEDAKRALWSKCAGMPPEQRAHVLQVALESDRFTYVDMGRLVTTFGRNIAFGAHSIPSPSPEELCARLRAPALVIAGWYDWNLNDSLASWGCLVRNARTEVARNSRLLITPGAHNSPGYRVEQETHPELAHDYRTGNIIGLLDSWYTHVREERVADWPRVIYYLMGANEWRETGSWPPPNAEPVRFYLHSHGRLSTALPTDEESSDRYVYDPLDPTPTVGGSIVSYVYPQGSVDVSEVQRRSDVLTYTSPLLEPDLDVVGPLTMILYASSSAFDTDFVARLSDVFPDGRAIQLQNGILRTRYREVQGESQLLDPGRVYRFEIDMWATANRFRAGHRLRLDISSADFPRFERNSNRGGEVGPPIRATQTVFHGSRYPSHLLVGVVDRKGSEA